MWIQNFQGIKTGLLFRWVWGRCTMACCRNQNPLPVIIITYKTRLWQKVLWERIAFKGALRRMKFNKKNRFFQKWRTHRYRKRHAHTHRRQFHVKKNIFSTPLTCTQNIRIFESTSFPWKQHSTDVLLAVPCHIGPISLCFLPSTLKNWWSYIIERDQRHRRPDFHGGLIRQAWQRTPIYPKGPGLKCHLNIYLKEKCLKERHQ